MVSWEIVAKQKIQLIYNRVRTTKKSNSNVAIINFTGVTIARIGSIAPIVGLKFFFFEKKKNQIKSIDQNIYRGRKEEEEDGEWI